ncbi:MAG TPA: hypothetical protein VF490_02030, partial [Chryseosolibacter sp.]
MKGVFFLASTGSATGLRQAQPPGFDRLSHRASTGSATGLRQAQPPGFDKLSHRAYSVLRLFTGFCRAAL